MKWLSLVLTAFLLFAGVNAEAARLGGGKSMGKQSGNVTQREAAPAQSAGNTAARPANAAAPAAPRRPWGAMLGGLAAGLGLAWLASSLGLGEGFGQILMFALLAFGVMMAVGYFMRRRQAAASPFAFQGAGPMGGTESRPYRPENVGNDASARPWEQNAAQYQSAPTSGGTSGGASGSMIGSALLGSQTWGVPAGFDSEGFIQAAKANFITLQAAWDKSDINSLRAMMTDGMLSEIKTQLSERETHTGAQPNHTDVQALDARLLGIEEMPEEYLASVEFTGMIREDLNASPTPFREVWNMTKPKRGGGWLVAGVQALQ